MENMLDGTALVMGSAVLTDVLDAPISKLAMGKGVDMRQHLFDGWTLRGKLAMLRNIQVVRTALLRESKRDAGRH